MDQAQDPEEPTDHHGAVERTGEHGGEPIRAAQLLAEQPLMVRGLPVFTADCPPANPAELFVDWLTQARRSGVLDAHAVTLSTIGADGIPDARIVGLQDIDIPEAGWVFAADASSPKGAQLTERPVAAMTLYWPEQGRQVRIRGSVEKAPEGVAAAEFLVRPPTSRAASLVGRQSQPLSSWVDYDAAAARARLLLETDPDVIASDHSLYSLRALEVEFWQGASNRRHVRLHFSRPLPSGGAWSHCLLWP
jgi:pyridoxamine 5'-phosphate oxidase